MKKRSKSKTTDFPPIVYAEASTKSIGGTSLFEFSRPITDEVVPDFYSESEVVDTAIVRLQAEGFEVYQTNNITVTIGGPPELYEKVFKTKLHTEERPVTKELRKKDTATFIDTKDTEISGLIDTSKSSLKDLLEGVAINEPVYYFSSPSFFPPPKPYWHLDVPADVSVGLNADRAHRFGYTGKKIKVCMVDSGMYRHPYFTNRGYRINPTILGPGAANVDHDEVGHGTGESANLFAIAPDIEFTMVKMSFVNSIGGFNAAVAINPHIISCSWGSSKQFGPLSAADQALAAAVANAVTNGITVVFSAGNGHWGFPAQHPDTIAAGGVYMKLDGSFEATPYASGFASNIYQGRTIPDCCGLVGLPPKAAYIMLPVESHDQIDVGNSGGTHPNGDETPNNDGWAAFSGTSAAAPALAGACALVKQACGKLTPVKIREILKKTSRDVTAGSCASSTGGHPAVPGPDLATGTGLVDAYKATILALLHCIIIPPLPSPIAPQPPVPIPIPGPIPVTLLNEDIEEMILNLLQ